MQVRLAASYGNWYIYIFFTNHTAQAALSGATALPPLPASQSARLAHLGPTHLQPISTPSLAQPAFGRLTEDEGVTLPSTDLTSNYDRNYNCPIPFIYLISDYE